MYKYTSYMYKNSFSYINGDKLTMVVFADELIAVCEKESFAEVGEKVIVAGRRRRKIGNGRGEENAQVWTGPSKAWEVFAERWSMEDD